MGMISTVARAMRAAAGALEPPVAIVGREPPPHRLSADSLISTILQRDPETRGQLKVKLSDADAIRRFYRWQGAAATALAEAVMMVPWVIEVREAGEWHEYPEHPMERLLTYPNNFIPGEELFYWTVAEVAARGKSHLAITLDGLNDPRELWPMIGKVEPKYDRESFVTGWKQTVASGGQHRTEDYEYGDEVFLRRPEIGKIFDGVGDMQMAGASIKLDEQTIESEWEAFKQGMWPFAFLLLDEDDPKKREAIRREIEGRYGGADKTQRMAGLPMGRADVKFPPNRPRDMGFHQGRADNRDEILGTMRVPAAILGLSKDVNRSSVEGLEYIWSKWRVWPFVRLLDARLNLDLARPHYGEDVRIRHEDPTPANKEADLEEEQFDLVHGVRNRDDIRAKRGLEPRPDGKGQKYFYPTSVFVEGEEVETKPKPKGQAALTQATGHSRQARRVIAIAAAQRKAGLERRYRKAMSAWFSDLAERVLAAWDEARERDEFGTDPAMVLLRLPDRVDRMLDPAGLAAEIAERTRPLVREGIYLGGAHNGDLVGNAVDWQWSQSHEAVNRYAAGFGSTHHAELAGNIRQAFVRTVAEGVTARETWDELRLRIVKEFGTMKESRSATIATTETTRLYNTGGQAFREVNELEQKQWVCSFVNSRETHMTADGQVVGNDQDFVVGAGSGPYPGEIGLAEEDINCNCSAVAYVESKT